MKKLLFTVSALAALSLLAPANSFAQFPDKSYPDYMGMYFDADGTGDLTTCEVVNYLDHITIKIMWLNPSIVSTGGFECGWDLLGKASYISSFTITYPTPGVDVGANNASEGTYNIIVGFGSPIPTSPVTEMADIDVFFLDGTVPGTPGDDITVVLRNADPVSTPGEDRPSALSADYLTVYQLDRVNALGEPMLHFNPAGACLEVLPSEDASWGEVKSLFR